MIHYYIYGKFQVDQSIKEGTKLNLWTISRCLSVILIMRVIELVELNDYIHTIMSTCRDLIKKLAPLLGIAACLYYLFALVGMELFGGKIDPGTFNHLTPKYVI